MKNLEELYENLNSGFGVNSEDLKLIVESLLEIQKDIRFLFLMYRELNPIISEKDLEDIMKDLK